MDTSSRSNSIPKRKFFYLLIFFLYAVPLIIFLVFIQNRVSSIYQNNFNKALLSFAQDIDEVVDVSKVLQTSLNEEINTEDRQIFPFSLRKSFVIIRNSELRPLAFNGSETVPNLVREISTKDFLELQNEGVGSYKIEKVVRGNEQYYQINYYSVDKHKKKYLIQILVPATYLEKENEKPFEDIIFWIPIFMIVVVVVSYLLFILYLSPIKKINQNLVDAKNKKHNIEIPTGLPRVVEDFLKNINYILSKERESAKDQKLFVAYASHELKTPLTVIKGVTDSLVKKEITDEVKLDLLDISSSIEEMQLLIEKLMDLASLNQNVQLSNDEIDLLDLTMGALDSNAKNIEENELTVNIINDSEYSFVVMSDFKLIKLLLDNLIQNAVKYSKPKKKLEISLIQDHKERYIKVLIDNYSEPIPDEELEMLERPFYRLSGVGDKDGAGLGLTIARRISELTSVSFSISNIPEKVRAEVTFESIKKN